MTPAGIGGFTFNVPAGAGKVTVSVVVVVGASDLTMWVRVIVLTGAAFKRGRSCFKKKNGASVIMLTDIEGLGDRKHRGPPSLDEGRETVHR